MHEPHAHPPGFYVLRLAVILGIMYGLGFGLFLLRMPAPVGSPVQFPRADGIVALTGGGGRLGPAVALLESGKADRLLITGVNPKTTKGELRILLKGSSRFDCCADLGFEANDTRGNAMEAAAWAREHGYRSLIFITSSDHMLRSIAEFAGQMPDKRLIPYAVAPLRSDQPLYRRIPELNVEFAKYVASSARAVLTRPVTTQTRGERPS
jgi:uncharacterized SAM-binding protein YcdF (DUF218 family)